MSFYGKYFKVQTTENHDAFLNSLGLSTEVLGLFKNFKSDQKIEKSGDNYIYTYNTPRGEKSLPFTSGVEFEDVVRDLSIKNIFVVDDNTVSHTMKFESGLIITTKKQFSETKMVEEVTNSNWNGVAYVNFSA